MRKSLTLCLYFCSLPVLANPDVTSREYKLMLDKHRFSFATEEAQVELFLQQAKDVIEQAIQRDVLGDVYLSKQRYVAFYDTPGECHLKSMGYSFRDRVTQGVSEVTLKFRSPDRYISGFEDLSSSSSTAQSKFESDVGINASSNFSVVYSSSTKLANSRKINDLKDINVHFSGFEKNYALDDDMPIEQVSALNVYERVYEGPEIDLGSINAEMSVTIWYLSDPMDQDVPLLAEVDFTFKDSNANYTKKVINRAKVAFNALQEMNAWTSPESETKTKFVYNYDPSFCY